MSTQLQSPVVQPAPVLAPALPQSPRLHRFTVDQYHQMIEKGILGEDDKVELLDGWIAELSPVGPPHFSSIQKIAHVLERVLPTGWHVRPQGPITLATSEPEPDVAIARGRIHDWAEQHPGGSDVALIVEVADSSLVRDRETKRQLYAAAGIAEYWILNLVDRQLEVYRDPQQSSASPEYRQREVIDSRGSVDLTIDGKSVGHLKVVDLLP